MGFLVRITVSDIDSVEDERELEESITKLYDRKPEWIDAMREASRTETRRSLRERGLTFDSFRRMTKGSVFLVQFPDEALDVPERYGRKLAKALYYLHTGKILPREAVIVVRVAPNSEFMSPHFPHDSLSILSNSPVLSRSGRDLSDQFSYRYGVAEDAPAAGFAIRFGESMVITAIVCADPGLYASRVDATEQDGSHVFEELHRISAHSKQAGLD